MAEVSHFGISHQRYIIWWLLLKVRRPPTPPEGGEGRNRKRSRLRCQRAVQLSVPDYYSRLLLCINIILFTPCDSPRDNQKIEWTPRGGVSCSSFQGDSNAEPCTHAACHPVGMASGLGTTFFPPP